MSALEQATNSSLAGHKKLGVAINLVTDVIQKSDRKASLLFNGGFARAAHKITTAAHTLREKVLTQLTKCSTAATSAIDVTAADHSNLDIAARVLVTVQRNLTKLHTSAATAAAALDAATAALSTIGSSAQDLAISLHRTKTTLDAVTQHYRDAVQATSQAAIIIEGLGGNTLRSAIPSGVAHDPEKLAKHRYYVKKYGSGGFTELPDGRIRYEKRLSPATNMGVLKGRRKVKEYHPLTNETRTWMASVDHHDRIRQIRPVKSGPKIHYMFDDAGNYLGKWWKDNEGNKIYG